MLKLYGSKYYLGSDDYRKNNYYIKAKNVIKEKYGTECYMKSDHFKRRIEEIQDKINKTKIRNNSFRKSKPEDECYIMLYKKFGYDDIKRQYGEDMRYPFQCDFYVKSLDLFIEYNGHWTHGKCPFIPSELNIKKLEKWKHKSHKSKFYKNHKNY